ncbi:Pyrrolo-quinoline quinone repeat-containing protein [Desulfotomaculum nigrificans CO-1-SRB]|uniref:Pyrrolo-quinoline quinone repeat-containing protein n=1 Tax=Desulfotomaculum nigrificans (strain DSM 14880 / VKM B-2319 / CO-1-SRB) TaxID=868595 RepID=F6B7U6_DESCC|nr:PQQ-binding-like beta-propeller repeat protein [Desulfotomaculum nigrificans]AEF94583.1 Pyrrolo-quinoline quinone repeat-containing protein [Desulfotomaculum nigrificans CO-1-SRB]
MRWIGICLLSIFIFTSINGPVQAAGRFYPYGEVKWMVEKVGKLSTEVTLTDNGLLYCPVGNKILCYDTVRGIKLWERKVDVGGKITEPLLVQEQTVYATGTDGIQQMKPNGSLTWIYRIYPKPKGTNSSGVVSGGPGGLIYLGLADGLYALEPKKNFKWRYSDDKNIVACLGDDRAVYVCLGDKTAGYTLKALGATGDRLWSTSLGDIKDVNMTFGPDGNLYVVTNPANLDRGSYGKVWCLDRLTGKEIWHYSVKAANLSRVTFSTDGRIVFCANSQLYCIDIHTGLLQWNLPLLNVVSGVAIDSTRQRIYAGSNDGRVYCVSFAGRLVWEKEIDRTAGQTLAKGGGIMIDTGKDEKDAISRAPVLLKDGSILVYTDKGNMYKFIDVYKER